MSTNCKLFLGLMLLSQVFLAQNRAVSLKTGDEAPALSLAKVTGVPSHVTPRWTDLRGKVLVIEFWATWCGPCIGAIPHLNQLAEEFKNKPVQFISVTEPPDLNVSSFLKNNPISGWVVSDEDKSISKSYRVAGGLIPATFIVNPEGRIVAITHDPKQVTAGVLEAVLAGKPALLPSEAALRAATAGPESMENVLVDVQIRANIPRTLQSKEYVQGAAGMSLQDMVATFYDITPSRIVWPTPTPNLNLNFQYRIALPESQSDSFLPLAQESLLAALGLKAHWEKRETNVLALVGPDGKLGPMLRPTQQKGAFGSSGPGTITAHGITANAIASSVESWTTRIVVNETRLQGFYNVTLQWDPTDPDSIRHAVRNQLGLDLVPTKRRIDVVVIDHISLPKPN